MNRDYSGIVKLVNDQGVFHGTAFFIEDEYCITCNDSIRGISDVYVEQDAKKYLAIQPDEYAKEKAIEVFKVKDFHSKPFKLAKESLPGLDVTIRGYVNRRLTEHHANAEHEVRAVELKGKLSNELTILPSLKDLSNIVGPHRELNLLVYAVSTGSKELDQGLSGAPVFYPVNNMIVG